jgi:hypothetical protein
VTSTFNASRLFDAATDILKAADALDDGIDAFLATVQSIGPACGDAEPIGMLLGLSTAAAEEVLVESLQSVVVGFEAVAGTVGQMAANDDQTEADNDAAAAAVGSAA